MAFLDAMRSHAVHIALLQPDVLSTQPLRDEIDEAVLREHSALRKTEVQCAAFAGFDCLEVCLLLRRKPRDAGGISYV